MKHDRETLPPCDKNAEASPRRCTRAEFLAKTGGAALWGALAAWTNPGEAFSAHTAGLAHFPDARWLAAPGVAAILNASERLSRPVASAEGRLLDALDIIPTPGHTQTHHSLKLECEGMTVIVAGDAVMMRDFFRDRRGSFNAQDMALSARTIDAIAVAADVVVPGHDNYFPTGRSGRPAMPGA